VKEPYSRKGSFQTKKKLIYKPKAKCNCEIEKNNGRTKYFGRKMRRSVKSRGARKARSVLQWAEQKVARDAVAAAARAGVVPNYAQRGLQLSSGEFKSVDVLADAASCSTTTGIVLLNGMTTGAAINQRVGREVTLRYVQFQYVVRCNTAGVDQQVRVVLVYDRQTNGSAPAFNDVFDVTNVTCARRLENRKRFKILYDRTHVLNAIGEAGSQVARRFYRRLRHPVTFNSGNTGLVGDITTGSVYLLFISTQAAGTNAALIDYQTRIRYSDN